MFKAIWNFVKSTARVAGKFILACLKALSVPREPMTIEDKTRRILATQTDLQTNKDAQDRLITLGQYREGFSAAFLELKEEQRRLERYLADLKARPAVYRIHTATA